MFLAGVLLVADSVWLFVADICSFGELSGVDEVVVDGVLVFSSCFFGIFAKVVLFVVDFG